MTYDLITVGRVNMDLFAQDIGAEFADITGFDAAVGGSPSNIAMGTSRLGLSTVAFTGVGDDTVGDFVLRYLADTGVVTDYVVRKPGKRISLALVGVQPPNRFPLTFYRDDPADIYLTIDDAAALPLAETRAVLLSGNAFSRGSCADASRAVAEEAGHRGLTIFMDLDLRPTDWSHPLAFGLTLRQVLPRVDVAIGTEEEFFALLAPDPGPVASGAALSGADKEELDGLVAALLDTETVGTVVLKRGAEGATVLSSSERMDVPGFAVDPVNTVGAGDSFASGLIWSRLQGDGWYQACRFGNACGAIVVTRHGCAAAFPTHDEVIDFVTASGGF
jgi:5-dehydro-2-deoxygluconokinase